MTPSPDAAEAAVGAVSWLNALSAHYTPASKHEALALVVHALLLRHGFRLPSAVPPEPGTEPLPAAAPEVPPRSEWLPSGDAAGFGTRYRHWRSALTFQVRLLPLSPQRSVVTAFTVNEHGGDSNSRSDAGAGDGTGASGDDTAPHVLHLNPDEYLRAERLLHLANREHGGGGGGEQSDGSNADTGRGEQRIDWTEAVRGWQRLATLVQVDIAHRLVPGSAKDGYERAPAGESTAGDSSSSGNGARARERRSPPPPPPPPPPPTPPRPGFPQPVGGGGGIDDDNADSDPLRVRPPMFGPPAGDDDLLPGAFPAMPRGMPPGARGGGGGGGGMFVGPNHPGFRGGGGEFGGPPLPPGAHPPGARYDPFGPPDADEFHPQGGRGGGGGSRRGGRGPQPGRAPGRPDARPGAGGSGYGDELPPPPDDMYW